MGYNTTVILMNDALGQIAEDKDFGRKLADAVRELGANMSGARVDVSAGNHSNAAHVVETHHANQTTVITVGGNLGLLRASRYGGQNTPEMELELVSAWAKKLGYGVVKLTEAEAN